MAPPGRVHGGVGRCGFWLVSDLCCHFGLPASGVGTDCNAHQKAVATFRCFWSGLAAIVFWPLYPR